MQNPLLDATTTLAAGCQPDATNMQTPSHLDHGSHMKDLGGPHFLISPVKFRSCQIAKLVQLGLAGFSLAALFES